MLIFIKTRPNLVLSVVLQLECVGGRAVLQYPLAGVEAELSTQQERAGPGGPAGVTRPQIFNFPSILKYFLEDFRVSYDAVELF